MTARVCVFEGEGAAPEAMRPVVGLLQSLGIDLDVHVPAVDVHADDLADWRVPEEITGAIHDADTVLFGAAQGAGGGGIYMPILKYLRNDYGGGLPANVRPVKYYPGASSPLVKPEGTDYAVVRENLEGSYFGKGGLEGDLDELRAMAEGREEVSSAIADLGDGAYALRIVTEANVRRLGSIVCGFAETHFDHRPVTLTCATKSNILGGTDGLFDAVLEDAVADSGVVEFEHLHVDNAGAQMVGDPRRFDLVVTTNAPGDILSDVGVATVGGLGLAPSGVFGEDVAYFEPVHGTAPDIAGQGIINPTATILSAVMMLRYLGFADAANRLEGAVETVYAEGAVLTPDQGGSASTTEMVEAIEGHL